jgi:hypothetical protein
MPLSRAFKLDCGVFYIYVYKRAIHSFQKHKEKGREEGCIFTK